MFGFLGKGSPFEIRYCELRLTHEFVSDHSLYNSAPKLRAYKAKKEKETIQIQSGGVCTGTAICLARTYQIGKITSRGIGTLRHVT